MYVCEEGGGKGERGSVFRVLAWDMRDPGSVPCSITDLLCDLEPGSYLSRSLSYKNRDNSTSLLHSRVMGINTKLR